MRTKPVIAAMAEPLEARRLLAVFAVSTNADAGAGSLRQAILSANANAGTDQVNFSIGTGFQSIALLSPLPTIIDPIVLDGSSQPGFTGAPLIELNGLGAGAATTGLVITAGNSTVRSLILNRFRFDGIQLASGGNNLIEACYIGSNSTGGAASANLGLGVYVLDSANNTIGGNTFTSAAGTFSARNLISGNNSDGIFLEGGGSSGNVVRNNYVGVNLAGTAAVANRGNGIVIGNGVTDCVIGGTSVTDRNVISGNVQDGIQVFGSGVSGNMIQGNYIGTRASGTVAVPNGNNGIDLETLGGGDITGTLIGGTAAGARNLISGNIGDGVQVSGPGASANLVQGN